VSSMDELDLPINHSATFLSSAVPALSETPDSACLPPSDSPDGSDPVTEAKARSHSSNGFDPPSSSESSASFIQSGSTTTSESSSSSSSHSDYHTSPSEQDELELQEYSGLHVDEIWEMVSSTAAHTADLLSGEVGPSNPLSASDLSRTLEQNCGYEPEAGASRRRFIEPTQDRSSSPSSVSSTRADEHSSNALCDERMSSDDEARSHPDESWVVLSDTAVIGSPLASDATTVHESHIFPSPSSMEGFGVDHVDFDGEKMDAIDADRRSAVGSSISSNSANRVPHKLHHMWCCRQCGKEPSDPITTLCGHIFCHRCIVDELAKNLRCPVCRTNLLIRLRVETAK